ncbi:hypothetical protein B6228_00035 [Candidatus Atribacteria bacterium 4572_76]|nr:MAG: hypothetical protein B6228_00035 [Candidatus Atribacteria bacterium 4572_76]
MNRRNSLGLNFSKREGETESPLPRIKNNVPKKALFFHFSCCIIMIKKYNNISIICRKIGTN